MIKIQEEDFNIEKEIISIKSKYSNIGATSIFIGYVRDTNDNKEVTFLKLEVYEKMAFKSLNSICEIAKRRWDLIDTLVIHRFGNLLINDKIVLVASFSQHRKDSMNATDYIMDYLKKEAPFWKNEFYKNDSSWLENY